MSVKYSEYEIYNILFYQFEGGCQKIIKFKSL